MKINKHLLVVALAAMPAAALQAQTYNDTVRTNTWTVYGAGGVSGYHGLRGGSDTGVRTAIAPDFSVGVKYNLRPWVRAGVNLGYTKVKGLNKGIAHSQTVTGNFQIGNYNDGILTVDKAFLVNRSDIHLLGLDLNADFNVLELWKERNERWNLWAGTGIGYYHGWNRHTLTTAVSEEGVAKGPDHFNVFNRDYVTTDAEASHLNTLYVPVRLSLEYDITPFWTAGVKGEYKCLPLNVDYSPKGIWSANLSLAYNFGAKPYGTNSVRTYFQGVIGRMNDAIAALRGERDTNAARVKDLEGEVAKTKASLAATQAALDDCQNAPHDITVNNVFFELDKAVVTPDQVQKVEALAELLKAYPKAKVHIKGYASPEGNADHNAKLAANRAKAVADLLVNEYHIAPERVLNEGCGSTDSLYHVFALNRVAVIVVEGAK